MLGAAAQREALARHDMRTCFAVFTLFTAVAAPAIPAAQGASLSIRPARQLGFLVSAHPLGVWCDGSARIVVGISNGSDAPLYVGLPRRSDATFPYKSSVSLSFTRGSGHGGGAGCGCSAGADCELCATPEVVTPLSPHNELAWTMNFSNLRFGEGPSSFRVELYWYGGTQRDDAFRQKLTGAAELNLTIERLDDRCIVAHVAGRPAG
jgi:hypothetical protein